jgi:hypothetical protein
MIDTRRAVELIAGLSWDPQFGHSVVVGLGGVFVEVYRDAALRLAPVDEDEALAMLRELKGRPILEGARGRPRADLKAVARVLVGLSNMALQLGPRLSAVDINPLFVLPEGEGARAGDALVLTKAPTTQGG